MGVSEEYVFFVCESETRDVLSVVMVIGVANNAVILGQGIEL